MAVGGVASNSERVQFPPKFYLSKGAPDTRHVTISRAPVIDFHRFIGFLPLSFLNGFYVPDIVLLHTIHLIFFFLSFFLER